MKVINLWCGPGGGKSTTAAGLFHAMKLEGRKVELVTEYAKELTYEERAPVLADQLYILAKQNRKLQRLKGQVDWVITDSPLPLSLVYASPGDRLWLHPVVRHVFHGYDNLNFLLQRTKPYQQYGRRQTEQEAKALDLVIGSECCAWGLTAHFAADATASLNILGCLERP